MKKMLHILIVLLFILTVFYPLGTILSGWFGYTLELLSIPLFAIAITVLSIIIVILYMILKKPIIPIVIQVFMAVTMPFCLINAAFMVIESELFSVALHLFVSSVCCCWLTERMIPSYPTRSILNALFIVIAVPVCFLNLLALTFGGMNKITVIQTIDSPNGKYYAQVIDDDQGALGGSTIVSVYENKDFNTILFQIRKKPNNLYYGRWGEFYDMQAYWKDETCLVINSVPYQIE